MSRLVRGRQALKPQGLPGGCRPVTLRLVRLEDRLTPAAPFREFVDPNPNPGNLFGETVVPLSTGNVVVTSPLDDFAATNAGAVYLFNGATGALISTLRGSSANDQIGIGGLGVKALTNGNFVVLSPFWDNGAVVEAGAVTFGNGITGISGAVSPANSLVGTTAEDRVGSFVAALTNGNYVVGSPRWDNGAVADAGATTFGNGTSGIVGPVSVANSLVGTTAADRVGDFVHVLTNGNYVVGSWEWDNGAATDAGAATFGNGTTGISGAVSPVNSLVGSATDDRIGRFAITVLTNGSYVVSSPRWDNGAVVDAGAATFGNGTTGISGVLTPANSLVGTTADDRVGLDVYALTNGNYVVRSHRWDNGAVDAAGAVTFGNGTTGITGVVSSANSLVGSSAGDAVGNSGITALTNGNYVVSSSEWDNGAMVDAGAATFGSGTTGITGVISPANSLVGTAANNNVGRDATALENGNYVVVSPEWDNGATTDVGAVTFANGTTGLTGAVSTANSLVGTTASDLIGSGFLGFSAVIALSKGNYVVGSRNWDNGAATNAGAATFASGTTGLIGVVSPANSLVGTTADDYVGEDVKALANGNYVVMSPEWDNGPVANAGAATFASGAAGIVGVVSPANSLVGTRNTDQIGVFRSVTALDNGNYVVGSPIWDNGVLADAGAVSFGSGTVGVTGPIPTPNTAVGLVANTFLQAVVVDNVNGTFFAPFVAEGGGRVRVGSQTDGFLPTVTVPTVTLAVIATGGTEAGSTVITVTATATAAVTGDATVTLAVTGSGITAGDFTLSNVTITIPGGKTSGSVTFTVVNDSLVEGVETATLSISNPSANVALGASTSQTIAIISDDPPPPSRVFLRAVGAGAGGGPHVRVYNADGSERFSFFAYDAAFAGGVRVATADVTRDGVDDILTAAGAGGGPHVKVFDGATGAEVVSFFAYDPAFAGGVWVAGGDVNGDGFADLVTGAGAGGGPHVKVLDGATGAELASFFAYDPAFRGGVTVATGDINADGLADLVTGAGPGGGPHVKVVEGTRLRQVNADGSIAESALLASYMAYDLAFTGGVNVSAGVDFNGDGLADMLLGAGPGGGPHVKVVDAARVGEREGARIADAALLANFFGYEEVFRGGVRVGTADALAGGGSGVILGAGPGGGPRVRVLRANGLGVVEDFFAFAPEFTGGVSVG